MFGSPEMTSVILDPCLENFIGRLVGAGHYASVRTFQDIRVLWAKIDLTNLMRD
jgi:hypothetical protein